MENPMDILQAFPVRKSGKDKAAFRQAVETMAQGWGYPVSQEKGSFGARNLVIGDPKTARYLVTAHYDTCARLPFPNLITPTNLWLVLAYQFLLLVMLLCVPFALSLLTGFLAGDDGILALWVGEIALLAVLGLMLFGPANRHNDNDNTSGVVTALEIAKALPEEARGKVCFVLFDLEEAGLIGSASYSRRHKQEISGQLVVNLDCVGDGDALYLFPTGKLKKDKAAMAQLKTLEGTSQRKTITLHQKGFSFYPSDQANFPYGLAVCALRKSRLALYISRIHTSRDTILEKENVNLLCSAMISFFCRNTAK